MNDNWLHLIQDDLQNIPISTTTDYLCSISKLGLIYISGDDSESFLQNQLSNDVTLIQQNISQLNTYSNHKGRVYSVFNIVKFLEGFLIILPLSQVEFMVQRLSMFIIMAKVSISDLSTDFACMGISSSKTIETTDQTTRIQINPNNPKRTLILCPMSHAKKCWESLKTDLTISDENAWELSQVNEGVPSLTPETSEAFVLQMINIHFLNGVSFTKGCYPGQEIVARTKYLGKAKRRMYLMEVKTTEKPQAGHEICNINTDKADGTGKILDSALSGEGSYRFLVSGKIDAIENQQIKLVDNPDASLRIINLPYSFEEKE